MKASSGPLVYRGAAFDMVNRMRVPCDHSIFSVDFLQ
jgi:hypothetical protein